MEKVSKEFVNLVGYCWKCRKEVKMPGYYDIHNDSYPREYKKNSLAWWTEKPGNQGRYICDKCIIPWYYGGDFSEIVKSENKRSIMKNYVRLKHINSRKKPSQRISNGNFREEVGNEFLTCIITGVDDVRLQDTCHIKPSKFCNEIEKLDKNNGLLLTPTYHRLFDLGLIGFTSEGRMLISNSLAEEDKKSLNLIDAITYDLKMNKERGVYLEFHREKIFKK